MRGAGILSLAGRRAGVSDGGRRVTGAAALARAAAPAALLSFDAPYPSAPFAFDVPSGDLWRIIRGDRYGSQASAASFSCAASQAAYSVASSSLAARCRSMTGFAFAKSS